MKLNRYNYNKESFSEIVKESYSISEVARKVGMKSKGGNWRTIKRKIKEYNLDISHFTGKAWNKGKKFPQQKYPLEEYLNGTRTISTWRLKNRLFDAGIKENCCEICGVSEWNGYPLMCELHHIDGNNQNNNLDNLQILCPNCHSQKDNFAGRSNRKTSKKTKNTSYSPQKKLSKEELFTIRSKANSRPVFATRKVVRPETYDKFKEEFAALNNNYCAMGRKYGVSDQAIRKWEKCYKRYGV